MQKAFLGFQLTVIEVFHFSIWNARLVISKMFDILLQYNTLIRLLQFGLLSPSIREQIKKTFPHFANHKPWQLFVIFGFLNLSISLSAFTTSIF